MFVGSQTPYSDALGVALLFSDFLHTPNGSQPVPGGWKPATRARLKEESTEDVPMTLLSV